MDRYFKANGVTGVITADMMSKAFCKLHILGLIKDKPGIVEAPEVVEAPVIDKGEWGIDPLNGLRCYKTEREIDLMSSDDYRRFHGGRIKQNFAEILERP